MQVLVVDDQRDIACSIVDYLQMHGIECDFACKSKDMLQLLEVNYYDVILLDVMMPGMSGFDACKVMRNDLQINIPVLFLTALDTLNHKLEGFTSGGDDYLVKPFDMPELLARVHSLASRGGRKSSGITKIFDVTINHNAREVTRDRKPIKLNKTQFNILCLLAKHSPNTVTKQTIEYEIWGNEVPESNVLKSQIYQLRNGIDKPFANKLIQNVHGIGFRLVDS